MTVTAHEIADKILQLGLVVKTATMQCNFNSRKCDDLEAYGCGPFQILRFPLIRENIDYSLVTHTIRGF